MNELLRWSGLFTTMNVALQSAFYRYLPKAERPLNDIVLPAKICAVFIHLTQRCQLVVRESS